MAMNADFHTHDYNGRSTAKMSAHNQSGAVAVITIMGEDGNYINLFGPASAIEAFEKIAELFNEAHHPKPKEIEHLGTVALAEEEYAWEEWNGDERPVGVFAQVEVKNRGGDQFKTYAGAGRWNHNGSDADVVAWRQTKFNDDELDEPTNT